MPEIFGKQNGDEEWKEKGEKKRKEKSGREQERHGLWRETALHTNHGRQCGSVEGAWLGAQVDLILAFFNLDKVIILRLCLPI